ncbi:MAG: hypothetical protein J6F30_08940 [Cellulosilyticum sp.]|nr:hypothetical protein [Cellulosilyticum sp.]
MSSTNKTTYYELPQFVDNDLFNPLVDDNDAWRKVDTALHTLNESIGDIPDIEAKIGTDTLPTTSQTLTGAIAELYAMLSNHTHSTLTLSE